MTTSLLTTKLTIPPVRPGLVPRPRLVDRLNAALPQQGRSFSRALTLVSAPAGFGKTTLLSTWLHQLADERTRSPARSAWLSLDEGDNDSARFLGYLVAALRTVGRDPSTSSGQAPSVGSGQAVGAAARTAIQSPQPAGTESILTTLINDVAALSGRPIILVLDDTHLIRAQAIHDALAFLIEHLPSNLHLVLATRADPPLPLARLRGRGQLTELRQADLRFTVEEAAAFLEAQLDMDLSPGEAIALASRTEGWIAGLQIAALTLRGREDVARFIREFTGSDRHILDYLVEEVLQRQPGPIQTFLLQTSILNRLTAPLCDAVTDSPSVAGEGLGDGSSQQILEQLERHNLFIVPLDNERRWYRYHRLFADLLRRRLGQMQPGLRPTLHRRASAWYERNGLTAAAIEHALRARDFERAAGLIEQIAEATLMHSELTTLLGWVEALPDELLRDRPSLRAFQAWALLLAGRPLDAVEARLQDVARSKAPGKAAPVRALLALYRGQIPRAVALAQQALACLPEDDGPLRNLATWVLSLASLIDGDLAASTQALDEVARASRKAGNVLIADLVLCNIASLRMQQAQLYRARDTYQRALEWGTDEQGRPMPIAGKALIGLGGLLHRWNELEAATDHLLEGIQLAERWGAVGAMQGYISLAQVRQAQGNTDGARDAICRAQTLALKTDATEMDDILVSAHQAQLWVAQGDLQAAWRWLEERGLTVDVALTELQARVSERFIVSRRRRTIEYVTLARILLAQGQPDRALAVLKPLLAVAERWGLSERVIRFQILRALAFQAQRDAARAIAALKHALALAKPAGYVRPFVDGGEPMSHLLYQAVEHGIAPHYAGRLLTAFPARERVDRESSVEMVEPLSERELEVLQYIAEGLSNREIAESLFISPNTVKWHTGNIYGKLGVRNRTQAVARSRTLGLL